MTKKTRGGNFDPFTYEWVNFSYVLSPNCSNGLHQYNQMKEQIEWVKRVKIMTVMNCMSKFSV